MTTLRYVIARTAPSEGGPWSEPVPVRLPTDTDSTTWGRPWECSPGVWKQTRVAVYAELAPLDIDFRFLRDIKIPHRGHLVQFEGDPVVEVADRIEWNREKNEFTLNGRTIVPKKKEPSE